MLIQYCHFQYKNNQDCTLSFVCATDTQHVFVDFQLFDIYYDTDNNPDCTQSGDDYLQIDGQKKCGSYPPVISTSNKEMEISFHSDGERTKDGFQLHLGCRGFQL